MTPLFVEQQSKGCPERHPELFVTFALISKRLLGLAGLLG
jgi:hypothetical protein